MTSNHWYLYMVRCCDGSLYTGVTEDKDSVITYLNEGNASSYVRARLPVFLTYSEEYMNEDDAGKRAKSIRKMSRDGKEQLLAISNSGAAEDFVFGV